MGVLGAPLYGRILLVRYGAINDTCAAYLSKNGRFTGSQCSHYGEPPYKAAPTRFFKIVWGLPVGTEDPQIQVQFNLPRYGR